MPSALRYVCASVLFATSTRPIVAIAVDGQSRSEQTTTTIRSQAQLDTYLRQHAAYGDATPLDALSSGGRERFLSGLTWGRTGVSGFDPADLAEELDDEQIHAVLTLFGSDMLKYAPPSRAAEIGIEHSGSGDPSDLDRRYTRFHKEMALARTHLNDLAFGEAAFARFNALFPEAQQPETERALSDRDLRLLWRAALQTANGSPNPTTARVALSVFEACERRGIVDRQDVSDVYRILLAGARVELARDFADARPHAALPRMPAFDDPFGGQTAGATVWRMDASGNHATRVAIDLVPTQILVTAGCHFSVQAAQDIAADPVLGPVFARHAHWLVNPPGIESVDAVRDWNKRFPGAQAEMIHERTEWAILPTWSMPGFHVVRNGAVLESVIGWPGPPARNRQSLIDALQRAGLLDHIPGDEDRL